MSCRSLVIATVLCWLLSLPSPARGAGLPYATQGQCDGFPRIGLQLPDGLCMGLIAAHLGFARGVAMVGDTVYVADMGGWRSDHGRILQLGHGGRDAPRTVLGGLDRPNALVPAPDGGLYVGLAGAVIEFDPQARQPQRTVRRILVDLPATGRHPLSALAVAPDGSLFVNLGSATDHCEDANGLPPDPAQACAETLDAPPRASVLHLRPGPEPVDARGLAPYARGLRNSMALAVLPSGVPVAAVNARDAISRADPALSEADLPHETYDILRAGADYGWPYCYDDNRPSPEYPHFDCSRRQSPTLLLPAHAAPLGMLLYRGKTLPGLDGQLLIAYHGYRANGHRIVALAIDADGHPRAAPRTLVQGWDDVAGRHPQGAPVALYEAPDGSLLVTEDHNGTLLRLAHDQGRSRPPGTGAAAAPNLRTAPAAYTVSPLAVNPLEGAIATKRE